MTVSNNYAPIRQLGNGVTTVFSGSWSMLSTAYALVELENVSDGVRTPVAQGLAANQCQIVITVSGFTVTFNTPPPSTQYVDISRVTGLDQTDSYTTSSGFNGVVEENSFDKLTCAIQDAAYAASQAITVPIGETYNTILPAASVRANGYLGFDGSGNVIVIAGVSTIPISSPMVPVVQAISLLAGFNLLAAGGGAFGAIPTSPTAAQGDYSQNLVTSQFVTQNNTGGYVNVARNPGFQIWQRGTSGTITAATPAYTADGFIVNSVGANVTWAQGTAQTTRSSYSLQITGNTSVTDTYVKQRIESFNASVLYPDNATAKITVQARIYNNTGAALVPTLAVNYPTATDNFASTTNVLAATNLQSIPAASWGTVSYTFPSVAGMLNGTEIIFDFGAALNAGTKSIYIGDVDVRVTPNVATGLNAAPPPAEIRPVNVELSQCQRYYHSTYGNLVKPGTATTLGMVTSGLIVSGGAVAASSVFPVQQRAAPTLATWDGAGNASNSSVLGNGSQSFSNAAGATTPFNIGKNSFLWLPQGSNDQVCCIHYTASSEL